MDYASDWFNHYGLKETIEHFDEALELICDNHSEKWATMTADEIREIHEDALQLYGLVHARWILQPKGLAQMKEKFEKGIFGECPRYACDGQKLLPIGETTTPKKHSVKLFCPKCRDIYRGDGDLNGAHFGTSFPQAFLIEYPELNTKDEFKPYESTIYGFAVQPRTGERFYAHLRNDFESSESDE